MCNPAFAMMAVSMAMAVGSKVMADQQQNKLISQQNDQANIKTKFDYDQLTNQAVDTNDASTQEKLQRQLQTARQRGQIAVAQGDAGVGGNSSLMIMNNAVMQERMDLDVMEANRTGKIRGLNSTMQGIGIGADGEHQNAESSLAGGPGTMLGYAMTAAQSGMSGYQMGSGLGKIGPSSNITPALKTHGQGFGK